MPLTLTALDAAIDVEARGCAIRLEPYQTALVPAAIEVVMLRSDTAGAEALAAAPIGDADTVPKRFARAAVSVNASTDFFAQF
jgi:hypothetical protein